MEIILLEDVKKVGKKGDLVTLSEGYARNFILPKKLGTIATNAAKNEIKLKAKSDEKKIENQLQEAKKLGEELKQKGIELKVKSGDGGRLFGSVTSKEIAKAIGEQLNIKIDKKKIQLSDPIKTLGNHTLAIKIHPKVTGEITVKVVGK